jgi:hypothetical protein
MIFYSSSTGPTKCNIQQNQQSPIKHGLEKATIAYSSKIQLNLVSGGILLKHPNAQMSILAGLKIVIKKSLNNSNVENNSIFKQKRISDHHQANHARNIINNERLYSKFHEKNKTKIKHSMENLMDYVNLPPAKIYNIPKIITQLKSKQI